MLLFGLLCAARSGAAINRAQVDMIDALHEMLNYPERCRLMRNGN